MNDILFEFREYLYIPKNSSGLIKVKIYEAEQIHLLTQQFNWKERGILPIRRLWHVLI